VILLKDISVQGDHIVKTEKIYYINSLAKEFEATIVSCDESNDKKGKYRIVLDRTAFFPEGGGQECDTGKIVSGTAEAKVSYVSEDKDGVISHLTDRPFDTGSTVKGTIDWDKRFSNMQHHSGEHIMSGLIKKYFDRDNVGFHLHDGSAVFDIAGTFTSEEIDFLEEKANKAVTDNIEIVTKIISKDELVNTPCRSKFYDEGNASGSSQEDGDVNDPLSLPGERSARNLLPLPDEIRIVDIEGVDTCACCAPHVKTTGQIGLIKIMNAEHFRGGTRFTVVCGGAALNAMRRLRNDELEIMHLLSAKQGETPLKVKQLADSFTSSKQSLYAKDESIAEIMMQSASKTGNRVLFCPDIDQNTARRCVNDLVAENPSDPVFFFIGTDEKGYRFIIAGGNDARITLNALKEKLDIKGGGSSAMVSGTVSSSREAIESAVLQCTYSTKYPRVILASASPRRKEILSKLKIPFEIIVSGADENSSTKDPTELVKELSLLKATDVFEKTAKNEAVIVIGSDTVVDLNGTILGKPHDASEAEKMLKGLSGNSHKVHTGLAVIVRDKDGKTYKFNESETSTVTVDTLTQEEINAYIASGEPFDKAGSYAIQGLFAPYISSIEGDYYNIVGLPLRRLYRIIKQFCFE